MFRKRVKIVYLNFFIPTPVTLLNTFLDHLEILLSVLAHNQVSFLFETSTDVIPDSKFLNDS